jgi:hypothetical protein
MAYPAQILGLFTLSTLTFHLPCSRSIAVSLGKREKKKEEKRNKQKSKKGEY